MRDLGIISKISKENINKKSFSKSSSGKDNEQELAKIVNDLPTTSENGNVIKNYLAETRWLSQTLKTQPEMTQEILRVLSITRDSSLLLGFTPVYRLYKATEDLYKAIIDGKAVFSDNLFFLINQTADKLSEMCDMIEEGRMEDLFNVDLRQYLLYLDKAVAGEIFNALNLIQEYKDMTLLLAEQSTATEADASRKDNKKEKNGVIQLVSTKI